MPRTRRQGYTLLLLLTLAATSRAQERLFPTGQGTIWAYEVLDGTGAPPSALTVRIVGREQIAGKDLLKLETTAGGKVIRTELISVDESGVHCHRREQRDREPALFDPPKKLYPNPLNVGTAWELRDEVAGVVAQQQWSAVAEEEVQVPAGKFRAIKLDSKQPWPISSGTERWFAPGTGVIKEVTTTRGPSGRLLSRVTTVLKKLELMPPSPSPAPTLTPLAEPGPPSLTIQLTPTPPPLSTPEPAAESTPTPVPDPAAKPEPKILLIVSGQRDGNMQTEFRSDVPNIFVSWSGQDLTPDAEVRVAWIAEDVGELVSPNFIVDQTTTAVSTPNESARFTLSRPADGWAAGKYRVELYVDDVLHATLRVTITD